MTYDSTWLFSVSPGGRGEGANKNLVVGQWVVGEEGRGEQQKLSSGAMGTADHLTLMQLFFLFFPFFPFRQRPQRGR